MLLLLLHLLAALLAPVLVRWWGRQAFLVLALVPAAGFVWVLGQLGAVLAGNEVRETMPWVPELDLQIALRLDALALTFAALVTGVGALVFLYCARYFCPARRGWAGSPATSPHSPGRCSASSSPTTCCCSTCSGSSPPSSRSC